MMIWKTIWDRIPLLMNYLAVAATIVLISVVFPSQSLRFKYQFEQGRTWVYEDLYAPFDFAVLKPASEFEAEIARLKQEFSPYYRLQDSVGARWIPEFKKRFDQQLSAVEAGQFPDVKSKPETYAQFGERLLTGIYKEGIISLSSQNKGLTHEAVIQVVRGNTTQPVTLGQLLTPEDARSLLTDSLPASRLAEPEFLYPILVESLHPNLFFDEDLTTKSREQLSSSVSPYRGMIRKGELIIPRGGLITDQIYLQLVSFREAYEQAIQEKKNNLLIWGGYLLLTALIIGVFVTYLFVSFPAVFRQFNQLLFILLWFIGYSYLVHLIYETRTLSFYVIPFAILPIILKHFFDSRIAFFAHLANILIASFMSSMGYEFLFLQMLIGVVVVLSRMDTQDWGRFFVSIGFLLLVYLLAFIGLGLIQEGAWQTIDWEVVSWLCLNALFTLLAFPLTPLLGRFFGFVSSITLVELADINRPLLRELAAKAPGTFQHSIQVANLSEAAARAIDANHLLARTGALYHDIGKSKSPQLYIENQSGNNPHEGMSFQESARRIIDHVTEGVELARRYNLPKVLASFIRTHHGTTRVEYFFRNYINANPDTPIDESLFRYPGPKPSTKEEAIVMMADTIEAACKSLKQPTGADIDNLIDRLITYKIAQGQFDEADLTFSELNQCKQVFSQMMRSVHHVRVEYPDEKRG